MNRKKMYIQWILVLITGLYIGYLSAQVNFSKKVLVIENLPEAFRPFQVSAGDLNGDALLDLVVPSFFFGFDEGQLIWLRNEGDDLFSAIAIDTSIDQPLRIVVGDLDSDLDPDILLAPLNGFYLYMNDGAANFTRIDMGMNALIPRILDLDQDNDQDILVLHGLGVYWLNNRGDSTFVIDTIDYIDVSQNRCLLPVDLDQDLDWDIVSAVWGDDGNNRLVWYENDGNENFNKDTIDIQTTPFSDVTVSDLDGDTDQDIIVIHYETNETVWYENLGEDNFERHQLDAEFNQNPISLAAGDLDQDGDQDIIVTGGNLTTGEVVYYENDGNGQFEKRVFDDSQGNRYHFALTDFDGDNDLDIIVPNQFPFEIDLYLNEGSSTLTHDVENSLVSDLVLSPNPTQSELNVSFILKRSTPVCFQIYDLTGTLITTLVDENLVAGSYEFIWDKESLASGVLVCSLKTGSVQITKKLFLIH